MSDFAVALKNSGLNGLDGLCLGLNNPYTLDIYDKFEPIVLDALVARTGRL